MVTADPVEPPGSTTTPGCAPRARLSTDDDPVVVLVSAEGVPVALRAAAAAHSGAVRAVMAERLATTPVPIPAVRAPALTAIVQFCEALATRDDSLAAAGGDAAAATAAHATFTSFAAAWTAVDSATLLARTRAAHYLDVGPALDACVTEVAAALRGAAPEAVRARFGIEADLTPAEEEAIKKECAWAFDCC